MKKPAKKKHAKKRSVAKVKRVKLTAQTVLVVQAPKGITPAIVPDPSRNAVEIVPVQVKQKNWWERTFGTN